MEENEEYASPQFQPDMIARMALHDDIDLDEDAALEVAKNINEILFSVVDKAKKFMMHSKRQKLLPEDVDYSLKVHNIQPHYGFRQLDFLPFTFSSGGGREIDFNEEEDEKEIDLNEMLAAPIPKLPLEVSLRSHWLSVDGVQPTVPENPPPLDRDIQKLESVDPLLRLAKANERDRTGKPGSGKLRKLQTNEANQVKQLATHELSVEQQLYYKEITEACVGTDEARRAEALQSLSTDPGLHEMIPRMSTFIFEGVKVNVVQNNLTLLIYLMRMVKALLDNPTFYLEKYLHELIPAVSTCIVSKQLCMKPDFDNHWALRDFASRLMAQICKNFNTSTNNVQTRVTRLFSKVLAPPPSRDGEKHTFFTEKSPLASLYGAIHGLSELGPEVIKIFILPRVKWIGERIEANIDSPVNANKLAASHIKQLMGKILGPIVRSVRTPPDVLDEYREEYGYLGPTLYNAVTKTRSGQSAGNSQVSSPVSMSPSLGFHTNRFINPLVTGGKSHSKMLTINPLATGLHHKFTPPDSPTSSSSEAQGRSMFATKSVLSPEMDDLSHFN